MRQRRVVAISQGAIAIRERAGIASPAGIGVTRLEAQTVKIGVKRDALVVVINLSVIQDSVLHGKVENIDRLSRWIRRSRNIAVPSFVDEHSSHRMVDDDAVQIPFAVQHGSYFDIRANVIDLEKWAMRARILPVDSDPVQIKTQVREMKVEALDINAAAEFLRGKPFDSGKRESVDGSTAQQQISTYTQQEDQASDNPRCIRGDFLNSQNFPRQ